MSKSSLFKNRALQTMLASSILVQIGVWVRNFSILLYVSDMTNEDEIAISIVTFVEFAPMFIFSIIGGAYADRWKPRLTLFWCDLLGAISILFVLLAIIYGGWQAIFLATFASAVTLSFAQPSFTKLVKQQIPEENVQTAIALNQMVVHIFVIIGPILGTFVYQKYGIIVSIIVEVLALLLSAGLILYLPKDKKENNKESRSTTIFREILDGVRYVTTNKTLTHLAASFFICGFAVGLIIPMGIFLVTEKLYLSKEYLGYILTAQGIGLFVGGFISIRLTKTLSSQKLTTISLLSYAAVISCIGLNSNFVTALIIVGIQGITIAGIQIGINTLIVQKSSQEYIGRVNGVMMPLFMGAVTISISLSGLVKNATSLTSIYQIAACFALVSGLVMLPVYKEKNELTLALSNTKEE